MRLLRTNSHTRRPSRTKTTTPRVAPTAGSAASDVLLPKLRSPCRVSPDAALELAVVVDVCDALTPEACGDGPLAPEIPEVNDGLPLDAVVEPEELEEEFEFAVGDAAPVEGPESAAGMGELEFCLF